MLKVYLLYAPLQQDFNTYPRFVVDPFFNYVLLDLLHSGFDAGALLLAPLGPLLDPIIHISVGTFVAHSFYYSLDPILQFLRVHEPHIVGRRRN